MTKMTVRFLVSPWAGHRGKWIARMLYAPKLPGVPFGSYEIKNQFLGTFKTKEEALAAVAAKKGTLVTKGEGRP